jgi:transposase
MYIRRTQRRYKGKTYTNYVLVESIRTPKGPRQRAVCCLGDLKPRSPSEWLELAREIEGRLTGQANFLGHRSDAQEVETIANKVRQARATSEAARTAPSAANTVSVFPDDVRTEAHREAGPAHVAFEFWKRLDFDDILGNAGLDAQAIKLTCAMTISRLVDPGSERATIPWFDRSAVGEIIGLDTEAFGLDRLYRNLDKLHPIRETIESGLAERERILFDTEGTIFLYDLTSTYFEGQASANPKAKRGYSRDHRPDCKQVVVGLVLGREGFPLAHEVFEGNVRDWDTLERMLDLLDRRVGLKPGQLVVVDRGLAYEKNLQELRKRKLHYLVMARQSDRTDWLDEFEAREEFEDVLRVNSPWNESQEKPRVSVRKCLKGDELHVLCVSEGKAEKERAIRDRRTGRFEADVELLNLRIEKGRLKKPGSIQLAIGRIKERHPQAARLFTLRYDEARRRVLRERIPERSDRAESLEGCYLLRTSRTDLSAEAAWQIYNLLTRAERAFRNLKSPLEERPIFHRLQRRVESHIFVCVLAYHLLVAIEETLRRRGILVSWPTIRDALRSHQICTVVLATDKGAEIRIRKASVPESHHRDIYRWLDLSAGIILLKPRTRHRPAPIPLPAGVETRDQGPRSDEEP